MLHTSYGTLANTIGTVSGVICELHGLLCIPPDSDESVSPIHAVVPAILGAPEQVDTLGGL